MSILPNIITSFRIVGAFIMMFLKPLSPFFYVLYTLCGLSDAVDGFVARITKSSSALGAKLDSIADLVFYSVMLIKILPQLFERLPHIIWLFVALVLIIRAAAYIVAAVKYHRFASLHTLFNKITSAALFTVVYFIHTPILTFVCAVICILGGVSSAHELVLHIKSENYAEAKHKCKV